MTMTEKDKDKVRHYTSHKKNGTCTKCEQGYRLYWEWRWETDRRTPRHPARPMTRS